jgi:uncharacterized protein (DUF1330 family)
VLAFRGKPLEGGPAGVHAVLRFESEQAALAWCHDPDHAPVRAIRFAPAKNRGMALAEGFQPAQG